MNLNINAVCSNNYVQSPFNAQNYNRYTYCLNNPLAFTDPTGYIQQSAFADGCYELTPAYSAYQRAFGLQNFLLNAGRNNTMLAMSPLVAIGLLGNSTSGGSWSRSTGMSYYKSNAEGLYAGCAYNNYFNSWGNTAAKSESNAKGAYDWGMSADDYLKFMSLTSALEGGVTPNFEGGDYLVFNGKQVVWYGGDGNVVASYKAVSGGLDFQNKKYQNQKLGPIPEGSYTINLTLDPNRVATKYEGNLFYNDIGIMKVPNWMKAQSFNPWGNTMARLEPAEGTNLWGRENNFYMHDSNKKYTSGCIEVQSSFFTKLLDYRQSNPSIMLFVFY